MSLKFDWGDEERRSFVECLARYLSVADIAKAAGISSAAVSQWLSGKTAPSDKTIEALFNAVPDYAARCKPRRVPTLAEVEEALEVIAAAARADHLKKYVADRLSALFPGLKAEIAYYVSGDDLETFRRRLEGEISPGQLQRYLRYLSRYFERVGWVLTPDNLNRVKEVMETPKIAKETAIGLKKFIDVVVKPKDLNLASALYASFKIPKSNNKKKVERLPSLEEVRRVWEEAAKTSPCAAAIWGLLAETGVRFDHLLKAQIAGLDLERRRLVLGETSGVKRQPLVFLTEGAAKYLRDVYLPWREEHLRKTPGSPEKLFPCKEHHIYNWLKEAREKAGLPWLEPSLLRKFNAQWLLDRGVDLADIAMLQGRALQGGLNVTVEHYIYTYERRLREVYERHAPRVFPNGG
ncbi:MAG: helix-turn-helix domain-containing protein [Thermoproteus sp.]